MKYATLLLCMFLYTNPLVGQQKLAGVYMLDESTSTNYHYSSDVALLVLDSTGIFKLFKSTILSFPNCTPYPNPTFKAIGQWQSTSVNLFFHYS